MKGLEFICKVFDISYKEVAEHIGTSNQTITDWTKGKTEKIPEKRLEQLVTKVPQFKRLKKEWFSMDLTPADKQRITTSYLLIETIRQLEEYPDNNKEANLMMLDDVLELQEVNKSALTTSLTIDAINLIVEHLVDDCDFYDELHELIIKHKPELKEQMK
ncbi:MULTISPECIES: hypothetical protein [Peribacillus]|uniref:hypothetical protein n=1 Tax=Peribacillus TaxID=2675229 RepID=UPI0020BDDD67|nr:hypothetical protein [Peribacillus frigoritolerans]